jgi:hypothetical protein
MRDRFYTPDECRVFLYDTLLIVTPRLDIIYNLTRPTEMTNHEIQPVQNNQRLDALRLMEQALVLLDQVGESTAAAHLDHAIASLGLPRQDIPLDF